MRQEPDAVRGVLLIVCLGLLGGCLPAEKRANRDWNRIGPGSSREEVVRQLGEGDVQRRPDGAEVRHYSYDSAAWNAQQVAGTVLLILTVAGIFILIAAAASQSGGTPPEGPEITPSVRFSGTVHFRVVFDRTGRVIEITGLEPCED